MDGQSFLPGTSVPSQTQQNQWPLGTHPPPSIAGPRPVILIVDRFLLLLRERGAPGRGRDQQDCEQELFHVNLLFNSWEAQCETGSGAGLFLLRYDCSNDEGAADEGGNRL